MVHGFWQKTWLVLKTVQARLRFVVIVVAIGVVIASWDTMTAYYAKWTRPLRGEETAAADTEYYCPMHPFIVRDNPKEKCPICHMDLAKRKKGTGADQALPAGTVSRVQLTPYRVVSAGVSTTTLDFLPLSKEITTYGSMEFDERRQAHIVARMKARVVELKVSFVGEDVHKDQALAVLDVRYTPELTTTLEDLLRAEKAAGSGRDEKIASARKRLAQWELSDDQLKELLHDGEVHTKLTVPSPIHGHVVKIYQRQGDIVDVGGQLYDIADTDPIWIDAQVYEADQSLLATDQSVTATTLSLPNDRPFTGKVSFIFPHLDEVTRTLRARLEIPNPEHRLRPHMYATVKIAVAPSQMDALVRAAAGRRGIEEATIRALPGADDSAGLGALFRQAGELELLSQGRVLAVPDSAVIDTGALKLVYRESGPNRFDGVIVELGPRMAMPGSSIAYYPVLYGLSWGDRVVTNGSFLIDAETRLNPAAGTTYFGAGEQEHATTGVRPSTPSAEEAKPGESK